MQPPRTASFDAIGETIAGYPFVVAAWVFGSVARDDAADDSDLDVALLLHEDATPSDERSLHTLAQALEAYSPSGRVDVVVLGGQGPVFRHRVLAEGVLVHDGDHDARIDYEGRTISEYLDWQPTHAIAMRSTLAGIRQRLTGSGP